MIKNYQILPNKQFRLSTENIILIPVADMLKINHVYPADWENANNTFDYEDMQYYFLHDLSYKKMPMHFFCEYVRNDYQILAAEPISSPSYFLEELASKMIIPTRFKNSIVIAFQDNYEIDIPDKRMEFILSKYIAGLMRSFKINSNNIFLFNEILTEESEKRLQESDLMYSFKKNIYFDPVYFKNILKDFY